MKIEKTRERAFPAWKDHSDGQFELKTNVRSECLPEQNLNVSLNELRTGNEFCMNVCARTRTAQPAAQHRARGAWRKMYPLSNAIVDFQLSSQALLPGF